MCGIAQVYNFAIPGIAGFIAMKPESAFMMDGANSGSGSRCTRPQ